MKRLLLLPVMLLALAVTGCAGTKLGKFVDVATTTITNPVRPVDMYRVKLGYAAALEIVADYRSYCWGRPYVVLMKDQFAKPICKSRRYYVRTAQAAKSKAKSAIVSADNFIRNNPTVNAMSVITAAWDAVADFKLAVPGLPAVR